MVGNDMNLNVRSSYLSQIATLRIFPMVLMKIFNLIVDENRWRQIFIDAYRDRAFGSGIDRRIDAALGVRIVERVVLHDSFKNLI